jgi:hypothetical protein
MIQYSIFMDNVIFKYMIFIWDQYKITFTKLPNKKPRIITTGRANGGMNEF